MNYVCKLGDGQRIDLQNLDDQTVVTISSSRPGQQQQSSIGLQTGRWTAPPEALRTAGGIVVTLFTAGGDRLVQIQGNHVEMLGTAAIADRGQPIPLQPSASPSFTAMPSIAPMPPLQPLKMGDMTMDNQTMTMKMGNMQMSMKPTTIASTPQPEQVSDASTSANQRRFCSQCGTGVNASDRFCAHCGHQLN